MKINEKRRAVRKLVDKMAVSKTEYFMADYISKQVGINSKETEKLLNELIIKEAPLLELNYRFICPNERCCFVKTFKKTSQLLEFKKQEICPYCGEELTKDIIDENTYNVYSFDEEYRKIRRKND